MQKTCSQCKASYKVDDTDLAFLKEFSAEAPDHCPNCRSQARMIHRNEHSLFKRTCDLCQKEVVAMYPRDVSFPVYCQSCFWGDGWDPFTYGKDYDPARSFFEQYAELLSAVPHLAIINKQSQNSEYCNYAYAQKDCYLTFGSHYEEDCLYDAYATKNTSSMDFLWMYVSELVYDSLFLKNCYRCVHLEHCEDCNDCYFSRDLKGCKNCLFCTNLHQKQYHVFNKSCTKEEFEKKIAEFKLHTYSGYMAAVHMFHGTVSLQDPVRAAYQIQCEDCEGSILMNCKNMRHCFDCADSEDCTYGFQVDNTHNCMDIDYMGYDKSERSYQLIGCLGLFECLCCNACWNGSNVYYGQFCFSCHDCFGCASLHQKRSCILNKQYEKSEYDQLRQKIIHDMQQSGEWCQFFPAALSPFGYNESMSQDWFPLSRQEVEQHDYFWREPSEPTGYTKSVPAEKLPDSIDDIPDDILNWAVVCQKSSRPFRIVERELEFYRTLRLPIPRLHPEERHSVRTARRHPRQLWNRSCMKCNKDIQTTYSPDRLEIVYCEECYLAEVY